MSLNNAEPLFTSPTILEEIPPPNSSKTKGLITAALAAAFEDMDQLTSSNSKIVKDVTTLTSSSKEAFQQQALNLKMQADLLQNQSKAIEELVKKLNEQSIRTENIEKHLSDTKAHVNRLENELRELKSQSTKQEEEKKIQEQKIQEQQEQEKKEVEEERRKSIQIAKAAAAAAAAATAVESNSSITTTSIISDIIEKVKRDSANFQKYQSQLNSRLSDWEASLDFNDKQVAAAAAAAENNKNNNDNYDDIHNDKAINLYLKIASAISYQISPQLSYNHFLSSTINENISKGIKLEDNSNNVDIEHLFQTLKQLKEENATNEIQNEKLLKRIEVISKRLNVIYILHQKRSSSNIIHTIETKNDQMIHQAMIQNEQNTHALIESAQIHSSTSSDVPAVEKGKERTRLLSINKSNKELQELKEQMITNNLRHSGTLNAFRDSTSVQFIRIQKRIKNLEFKNEVLENAAAVGKFQQDQMKLWKQDIKEELNQIQAVIPESPAPYDDKDIQNRLQTLATKTTEVLLNIQNMNGNTDENNVKMKAALEEQASAIAHLVATKADQVMVTEQLNSKAGAGLEESIRSFMKQVAHDIDERDYRSTKISSCERAAIETRILKLVTSSLRRLRRQQTMLAQALPQTGRTSFGGIVYKCLACDQSSVPDVISRNTEIGLETLRKGRSITAPHEHVDFQDIGAQARRNVHVRSPYKVKGAGFRINNSRSR
jgi:hypothetical protein